MEKENNICKTKELKQANKQPQLQVVESLAPNNLSMICGFLKTTIVEKIVRGTLVKLLTNLMLHHEVTHTYIQHVGG